jgi:hypothetical protein
VRKYIGISLLVISLIYSIEFYIKINMAFAIFIISFEICKLILLRQDKTIKVKIIIIITSMFIIFGFISNTLNKLEISSEKQYKKVTNEAYLNYVEDKKLLENQIEEAKKNINNYPSFENLGLTKWEDKTDVYNNWTIQRNVLNDKYNKLIDDLNKLKRPAKFKNVKINNAGLENIFISINVITNIPKEKIILFIALIIALIMEFLQYEFLKNPNPGMKNKSELILKSQTKDDFEISDVNNINRSEMKNKSEISNKPILVRYDHIKSINGSNEKKSKILEYKKISDFLINNYKPNERIKKFQSEFSLSISDYRKVLEKLKEENIIYTKNRNTYLQENKLKIIKNITIN